VTLGYPSLVGGGTGYLLPIVKMEFGARSTGQPSEQRPIVCDIQEFVRDVAFPTCESRVMRAERTFWEKATAMHVYCLAGHLGGDSHHSRHWHDVVRLDGSGVADQAIANRQLALDVAAHKSYFFKEKAADESTIDYVEAVSGGLQLVPPDPWIDLLRGDYAEMLESGMLLDDAMDFDQIMTRCHEIEAKANAAASKD
jgi:hypothetical protein